RVVDCGSEELVLLALRREERLGDLATRRFVPAGLVVPDHRVLAGLELVGGSGGDGVASRVHGPALPRPLGVRGRATAARGRRERGHREERGESATEV